MLLKNVLDAAQYNDAETNASIRGFKQLKTKGEASRCTLNLGIVIENENSIPNFLRGIRKFCVFILKWKVPHRQKAYCQKCNYYSHLLAVILPLFQKSCFPYLFEKKEYWYIILSYCY